MAGYISEWICSLFPFSFSKYIYVDTYAELHDFLGNDFSNMTRIGGPIADNGSKSISERRTKPVRLKANVQVLLQRKAVMRGFIKWKHMDRMSK